MFGLKLYKHPNNPDPNTATFHGGAWIEQLQVTWPFGRLEVSPEKIVISIEEAPFFSNTKLVREFRHEDLEKIEVKKYFPIIAYGVQITPRDKTMGGRLYFWYTSFGFKKLQDALIKGNWIF